MSILVERHSRKKEQSVLKRGGRNGPGVFKNHCGWSGTWRVWVGEPSEITRRESTSQCFSELENV